MIFRVASIARARAGVAARHFSSVPATGGGPLSAVARAWYNVFGVSTARYAAFLAIGCIVAEFGTNALTDALWEMNNKGKTYAQVDWSKFDPVDEEEEEEEEEDDDDE